MTWSVLVELAKTCINSDMSVVSVIENNGDPEKDDDPSSAGWLPDSGFTQEDPPEKFDR
jgi:hypothetical protein